eukprot:scaffold409494_cov38-Prasinocladus_malaysianus.AAC.3
MRQPRRAQLAGPQRVLGCQRPPRRPPAQSSRPVGLLGPPGSQAASGTRASRGPHRLPGRRPKGRPLCPRSPRCRHGAPLPRSPQTSPAHNR